MLRRSTRRAGVCFVVCAAFFLAIVPACGGGAKDDTGSTGGPTRSFMMGLSSLPRELNATAYATTFDLAAENGEMVLIQRAPPWEDFLPGNNVSGDTASTSASEKDAVQDKDLTLFVAIDPTDGSTGRDRLSGLPGPLAGKGFGDPDVRRAFTSYAEYVALNYEPEYLALGVEMNLYYEKNKEDFENFRTLYFEAYDAVKEISPDTQVTVTFQYEDLQGILPREDKHFPSWQLVKAFDPKMDILAISTYPSFAFSSADAIPSNYYSQLRAFTDKPIAIAEMGYSSASSVPGVNGGTEGDQAAFLEFVLGDASANDMRFVVWFAGWDPTYAKDTPYGAFQHIGLLRDDNSEKPAWRLWAEAAQRPYVAAGR